MTRNFFPNLFFLSLLFLFPIILYAQGDVEEKAMTDSKVIISGFVFDEETLNPIGGAIVEVITVYPRRSSKTDLTGEFSIKGLPLGNHKILVEAPGYEFKEIHNILLTEDKHVLKMEILLKKGKNEVEKPIVKISKKPTQKDNAIKVTVAPRDLPINETAIVSLRSFSQVEMSRFAGSRQDPSRMLANYMGLRVQDDYNNGLIARGNSTYGFQWRMEGVPMPNPGYLGDFNLNGGMANVFSPSILQQSDVMIGAFSAQYGNVNAGVFDARLRENSVEKLTLSGQAHSTTGVELLLEGNIGRKNTKKGYKAEPGYFFVNYRLSKLNYLTYLMAHAMNSAHQAPQYIPTFQDLSFKVILPSPHSGVFTLFGLSGFAAQKADMSTDANYKGNQFLQWGEIQKNNSIITVSGVKHRYYFKETRHHQRYIQTTAATTFLQTKQQKTFLGYQQQDTSYYQYLNDRKNTLFISTEYHHHFDKFLSFEGGVRNETYFFNLKGTEENSVHFTNPQTGLFASDEKANTNLLQAYTLLLWKPLVNMKVNMGLHTQWFALTNSSVVEPRFAFRWEFTPMHFVSFGYGLHSQIQPLQAYFTRTVDGNEISYEGELNKLGFTRSHHFVIGYDWWINNDWRFHAELYHIEYFNVPVDTLNKAFSMLNYNGGTLGNISNLANAGGGYSQGLELSVERYFSKGFYFLASTSLYKTYYTDYLGRERNISFNNSVNVNVLAGKEFFLDYERNNSLNIDLRLSYGGPRYAEIVNSAASSLAGYSVYTPTFGVANANMTKPYFRADFKIGYTIRNSLKGTAHNVFVDLVNFTGMKNSSGQYFDRYTQTVQTFRQMPFFIDFGYRFKF